MHDIDIAELLRRALLTKGCTEEQMGSFDGHSNIELLLRNIPSLNVERIGEDYWFWSAIENVSRGRLEDYSAQLLTFLMQNVPFTRSGQLQLSELDGRVELRAQLNARTLSDEQLMGDALDQFVDGIQTVHGLLLG